MAGESQLHKSGFSNTSATKNDAQKGCLTKGFNSLEKYRHSLE